MSENNEDTLSNKLVVTSEFTIKDALFHLIFLRTQTTGSQPASNIIKGFWENRNHLQFKLQELADFFKITLPDFMNLKFEIEKVILTYMSQNSEVTCEIVANCYINLKIGTNVESQKRKYFISYESESIYEFKNLPIIGDMITGTDGIGLKKLELTYSNDCGLNTEITMNLKLNNTDNIFYLDFNVGGKNDANDLPKKNTAITSNNYEVRTLSDTIPDKKKTIIKWFDINKSLKCLRFKRAGIELTDSNVKVYLSAGFTIAVIEMDFYDLFISIPLTQSGSVSFGLQGLSVAFVKPPVIISGGLYKVSDPDRYGALELYNGELMLKITKFAFVALASYGKMKNGDITFFLYVMVSIPIGGPPYFFVNGFVLGFGVNRTLKIPDVKNIAKFPFVGAVLFADSGLSKDTSPQQALDTLSDWVIPSSGDYFIVAGIKFLSFGVVQSVAMLMLEFGKKLRISLLGVATVSLPPKISSDISPIAYAQLALQVTYDNESGEIKVLGALTSESYVLDKRCKLTGGFGFCIWSSGKYEGDFLVTIGGCHHPAFVNKHYPELDQVGINGQINNVKLVGGAYFALTPSCIMAGASMELSYVCGNLSAWLKGNISFYMGWKPFKYDINISVSIGASYTVKIWKMHKTFSLEIGAGLHIYGPDFSGEVHIRWYIISFTISFGSGKSTAEKIEWADFASSFLPEEEKPPQTQMLRGKSEANKRPCCKVNVAEGMKRTIILKDGSTCYIVSGETLLINAQSAMPCTELRINGVKQGEGYSGTLGIVPMKIDNFKSTLTVDFIREKSLVHNKNKADVYNPFKGITKTGNIPAGLYKNTTPGMNDDVIRDVPVGMDITLCYNDNPIVLPSKDNFYKMKDLMESEIIDVMGLTWKKRILTSAVDYSRDERMDKMRKTILNNALRVKVLADLAKQFKTSSEVYIKEMGEHPEDYLMADIILASTGAVNSDVKLL